MTDSCGVKIGGQIFGEACTYGTPVYLKSDGKWWKTNATSETTCTGDVGLCLEEPSVSAGGKGLILTLGYLENPAWTWVPGTPVYFAAEAGGLTQTKPSSGGVIRVAGYPSSSTVLHFVPADPVIPESLVDISGLPGERGDILIHGESGWTQMHAGTEGQFLRTRGSGYDPLWDWTPDTGVEPIGVKWDTSSSSPTLTRVDANGTTITLNPSDFDHHPIYGQMWRCVRDRETGEISYGLNARGDGLTLDGTAGDVLVRVPRFYVKAGVSGTDRYWWISPVQYPGFEPHPWFYQRGGGLAAEAFVSAYEAYGYLDGSFRLGSATGKTPVTGGVAYPGLPNSGRLTIDDVETYAQNAGLSGGLDFWGWCALQLLFYVEYASLDSQTALAKGISELAPGEGFAGKNTGADSADTNIGLNGTGVGTGTNGQTPVVWRGIENLWGNTWTFAIGANFQADGSFRLLNRDGSGTPAGWLAEGTYETGTGVPLENGYISGYLQGDLESLAFLPSAVAGSSSTYACDYWYAPGGDRILLAGGTWSASASAGPGSRPANYGVAASNRAFGARLEFIPQGA